MTREVKTDTQEIFSEMQDDLARDTPSLRRNRIPNDSDSSGKPLLLWGFIGIILILLLVLLFRGGDKAVTADLNALKGRVEQMEKRMATPDAAAKKLDTLDGQIKGLQQSLTKIESTQRSLAERIEKVAQHAERPPAPPAAPAPSAPQKKPGVPGKVHEVRPGETVFSIAKKYNLTVDQFLKLNNMSKRDTLQAGQKVLVAP